MNQIKRTIVLSSVFVVLLFSCRKIKCDGSNPTYTADIKSIIEGNCNSSGCHGTGSSNGVFTSYSGMKSRLDNGSFKRAVLEDRSMPEGSRLSKAQLQKIQCWSENGYPEN